MQHFNANQVSRHLVDGDHTEYLTDRAYKKARIEFEVSNAGRTIKIKPNEYWVYMLFEHFQPYLILLTQDFIA